MNAKGDLEAASLAGTEDPAPLVWGNGSVCFGASLPAINGVALLDEAGNGNVGFDDASPVADPDASFVPEVKGWPNADEALPAGALNENVGLDVAADDVEDTALVSPDAIGSVG